jgi:hypothetical protein
MRESDVSPKSRPLLEQVSLAERIMVARHERPRVTWEQLAEIEGVPKRTLQHFWAAWREGVASDRPGAYESRRAGLAFLHTETRPAEPPDVLTGVVIRLCDWVRSQDWSAEEWGAVADLLGEMSRASLRVAPDEP